MYQIAVTHYKTEIGELILGSLKDELVLCDWAYRKMRQSIDKRICQFFNAEFIQQDSVVIKETKDQLQEYLNGQRRKFDLPIKLAGSNFQVEVWKNLQKIPYGQMVSYSNLAEQMKQQKAIRAIASANGANAHSIIIPCHRVVGSRGELVGYAGGLSAKRKLLELEGAIRQTSLF